MAFATMRVARWLPLACILFATTPSWSEEAASPERVLIARRGDTLASLLQGAGVEAAEREPALAALTPVFPARALHPGHEVTLRFARPEDDDNLLAIEIDAAPGHTIIVERQGNAWRAREERAAERRHLVRAEGSVQGALFENMKAAGLPPSLALGLIRTLAYTVDFQRDLQPGDRFAVLFERFRDPQGELLRHGRVLQAELTLSGRRIAIWRHDTATGSDWYDEDGRSLRRAFLRTPLDGARISSGFGMRHHPVLGYTRMHQGVDFAAPTGTPVYAAADGVVASAGMANGYGRLVKLRHGGGTETHYAHLSAFARGLKPGQRVRQGDVIGRVGSSGLATGPHLHYELVQAGRLVNPASRNTAIATRLTGRDLAAYQGMQRRMAVLARTLGPMQEVAAAQ